MGKEIERFTWSISPWKPAIRVSTSKQGYLNAQKERVVRVRIEGERAKLTIKGMTTGRHPLSEFEYDIPLDDASELLDNPVSSP